MDSACSAGRAESLAVFYGRVYSWFGGLKKTYHVGVYNDLAYAMCLAGYKKVKAVLEVVVKV